ncbi:MAG TPA: TIGR02186 family protein [Rhizomicrobium sp.]|jgi:uncharacterized protein (TIGR02186 family)|nr:TIGR02186 family protein [Rhizomicrobium sp.]
MRLLLALFALCLVATGACAEDLVSGLSQDQIQITSNYAGTDIVVFGAIESPETSQAEAPRDVVVVVRGPDADFAVRRKARVAGIWINRDKISLYGMPAYYYVASTRPLAKIAADSTLSQYQIGVSNLRPKGESTRSPRKGEPFRLAAIRLRERQKLYTDAPAGVEFLGYSLFRVRVPVPASVATGEYAVQVYLFRDGNVVSAQTTPLFVDQIGLERRLFRFAHGRPFWYGLATVAMAILLGWGSSFLFRRQA